jgi:hypothetical protein
MEIRVEGDKEPVYDLNLEDLGRYNETPVLPFNAYGTLAWARAEFDNNSASSQVRGMVGRIQHAARAGARVRIYLSFPLLELCPGSPARSSLTRAPLPRRPPFL